MASNLFPATREPARPAGLGAEEAAARLRRDGPNRLPQPERRSGLAIAARVLREPMLLLLLAAAGVYLLLGNPIDAALLGASVALVIGLTIHQEAKAEHALQALRELGSPRARVLRDGVPVHVAAQDVVVGDLLLVAEGDRLAADARVLDESDLQVDESLLTGESLPQRRTAGEDTEDALLHAGTLVVRGRGMAEVVATGIRTAVGRIGVALHDLRPQPTPLQREMRRIVLLFASLSLASCAAVAAAYFVLRGGWLDALLAGLTLAIATIPEEFPVVLTVFLALGAWRMARHKALVRRAPAIEALGATTVLCTDKTGTLTENRMRVAMLVAAGERWDGASPPSPRQRAALRIAMLASPPLSHDPMEHALHSAWATWGEAEPTLRCARDYAFSPECPAVAGAWAGIGDGVCVACKGAPETVAALCALAPAERALLHAEVVAMAAGGLRVLGLASARYPDEAALPATLQEMALDWDGLVAFADPLRAGVPAAVAEARAAGVRVLMLTGDHPQTARAIAREAGLARPDDVVLGADFAAGTVPPQADVYARVRPEHKLQLVEALQRRGEVVAMTGDGVNDAPALMAAHVGVAMGGRGTDVAREAAAIVLLDDDFTTIVRALRLGRAIYDNIRRAVRYILAVHVPIAGLALLPMFAGGPLVLLPLHVVFLEVIIDPACSIVFEREPPAPDLMRRPPRPRAQRMLDGRTLLASLAQGAAMFAAVAVVHLLAGDAGLADAQRATLAFSALVAGNLGLIVLYRSDAGLWATLRQRNPAFWSVVVAALAVLAAVTWLPPFAAVFRFAPPPASWWLASLVLPLLLAALLKALAHGPAGRRLPARRAGSPIVAPPHEGEPP